MASGCETWSGGTPSCCGSVASDGDSGPPAVLPREVPFTTTSTPGGDEITVSTVETRSSVRRSGTLWPAETTTD